MSNEKITFLILRQNWIRQGGFRKEMLNFEIELMLILIGSNKKKLNATIEFHAPNEPIKHVLDDTRATFSFDDLI